MESDIYGNTALPLAPDFQTPQVLSMNKTLHDSITWTHMRLYYELLLARYYLIYLCKR